MFPGTSNVVYSDLGNRQRLDPRAAPLTVSSRPLPNHKGSRLRSEVLHGTIAMLEVIEVRDCTAKLLGPL